MNAPYYQDESVTLYLGDCREVLPALNVTADCIVADPPYGETSLEWDRWPEGWLEVAMRAVTRSMWCFGSLRMIPIKAADEFAPLAAEPGRDLDQAQRFRFRGRPVFKRFIETIPHWYRGSWSAIYREVPRIPSADPTDHRRRTRKANGTPHAGQVGQITFRADGMRLTRSVIAARSLKGCAAHPTEKPGVILVPLIAYACPPGGLVVDPFAGSGSTLDAARCSGRRAIGIEGDESYAERAARRLSQMAMEVS